MSYEKVIVAGCSFKLFRQIMNKIGGKEAAIKKKEDFCEYSGKIPAGSADVLVCLIHKYKNDNQTIWIDSLDGEYYSDVEGNLYRDSELISGSYWIVA